MEQFTWHVRHILADVMLPHLGKAFVHKELLQN